MELLELLGRAAVPVRLIPHLAPCLSAEELALILARQDARCKWDLSAHWLRPDGTVGDMHPDQWHAVALDIGLLGAKPDVLLQAMTKLPAGVFVWRDELESEYPKLFGEDGKYSAPVTNGSEDYEGSGSLSFDRPPSPHPELIYAGFEHAMANACSRPAASPVQDVQATDDSRTSAPTPLTHKISRRASPLAAVLALAKDQALDPTDWLSTWAALVKLAGGPNRPPPLTGYIEGEGVKYQTDDADRPAGYLTRDAFRKRFERKG